MAATMTERKAPQQPIERRPNRVFADASSAQIIQQELDLLVMVHGEKGVKLLRGRRARIDRFGSPRKIARQERDAFHELVLHPTKASVLVTEINTTAGKNRL